MCMFGYYVYEECGHKGIEIVSHCVERLWKAGIDGQLWACPELQYVKHLMELAPITWEGRYSFCKYCQMIYAIPETVSYRSFNDVTVPAERPQIAPPVEDTYIYTPFVTKTVPELLGIEDQIPPEETHDGYKINFPSNLNIYDRTEAGCSFQWLSQGWYAGKRVGPLVSWFSLRNGMTSKDQDVVAEAIMQGRLLGMWRQEFERRGMPWTRYLAQARIIGESIGIHTLEPRFWDEVNRTCSV